ncbi:MAG: hypothetical protein AAF730_11315 [Bacteroidota bacterium]
MSIRERRRRRTSARASKISTAFEQRLSGMGEHDQLQVLIMVNASSEGPAQRQSRRQRAEAIQSMHSATDGALDAIDAVLNQNEGQRLGQIGTLGTLPATVTVQGVRALAALPDVRTILENQDVTPLDESTREGTRVYGAR